MNNKIHLTEDYKGFIKKICFLYENLNNLDIEKNKVKTFIENILINDSILEIEYRNKNNGRLFGSGGIQNIEGAVRSFIFEGTNYKDVDIISAVSIL